MTINVWPSGVPCRPCAGSNVTLAVCGAIISSQQSEIDMMKAQLTALDR